MTTTTEPLTLADYAAPGWIPTKGTRPSWYADVSRVSRRRPAGRHFARVDRRPERTDRDDLPVRRLGRAVARGGVLAGEDVLPGFSVSLAVLFGV